jgi:hypothetical protein
MDNAINERLSELAPPEDEDEEFNR